MLENGAGRRGGSRRELQAFLIVPPVAAATWWALMMVELGIANGRLRLVTDLVTFGIGASFIGIPLATAITMVLALPLYLVLARLGWVSFASAALSGVAIGAVYAWVGYRIGPALPTGVWVGPVVGLVSAAVWWRVAGKPDRRSISCASGRSHRRL